MPEKNALGFFLVGILGVGAFSLLSGGSNDSSDSEPSRGTSETRFDRFGNLIIDVKADKGGRAKTNLDPYSRGDRAKIKPGKGKKPLATDFVKQCEKYLDVPWKLAGLGPGVTPIYCTGRVETSAKRAKQSDCEKIRCDPNKPGIDCSGLTKRAAMDLGISIPRMAQSLFEACRQQNSFISEELAIKTPGAFMFYWPQNRRKSLSITHVDVLLGDGKRLIGAHIGKTKKGTCDHHGKSQPLSRWDQSETGKVKYLPYDWYKSKGTMKRNDWKVFYAKLPHLTYLVKV